MHAPRLVLLVALFTTSLAAAADDFADLKLAPHVEKLPSDRMGPFVKLGDGSLLTIDGTSAFTSRDGGKTWAESAAIFPQDEPFLISNERALLRKKNGVIVLAFMNLATRSKQYWVKETNEFTDDIRLDVWTVRSTDDGRTWTDAQRIQDGYCGAIRSMVEAADGTIVVEAQNILRNPSRHMTTAYTSRDDGKSWTPSQFVGPDGEKRPYFDIGGHGHHDGAIESCLAVLNDGRIWMLIRTGHDYFWQAFSHDNGATWTDIGRTTIDASSAPGQLLRLSDGRLVLVWNRLYPEGKTEYPRKELPWHKVPSSYHREELSLAFSGDDGKTWSKPTIIARRDPGKWVSYAYLFEPTPGELWVTTMQGGLRARIRTADF